MSKKQYLGLLASMLVVALAADSSAITYSVQIIDSHANSYLYNVPDGTGDSFSEAFKIDGSGTVVDASVTIKITNGETGSPITSIDGTGFYLELYKLSLPYVDWCSYSSGNGSRIKEIDHLFENTSSSTGEYVIDGSLTLGGYSGGYYTLRLYNPYPYSGSYWVSLANYKMISSDMDGDGDVDLADSSLFSTVYYGTYHEKADFYYDGSIDLSDVGRFANANGSSCP